MTGQALANQTSRKLISILGILAGSATIWGTPAAGADPTKTVSYELTGSGVAGYVTYQTDTGQQHATNVPLPWSMQVTRSAHITATPAASTLSAQGTGPGSITCTIKVDKEVVSQNTATGDPARVVCENHGAPITPTTTTTRPGT